VIGSAGTGGNFRGLGQYLLRDDEGERVGWTLVRNLPVEPELAAGLMDDTARQNVRVQKPVYHLSISAAPGEELSREQWEQVVGKVLRDLGLEEHQALVVHHRDKAHDHVHVMVNRVHPENLKVWHNGHDYRRIEKSLRRIEREMKLREVPGRHGRLPGQERPERTAGLTGGEKREAERTGREPWAERVRFKVYEDLRGAKSWAELEKRLERHGLRLEKRGPGLVVTDGERRVKASRLYRGASYGRLEKRFGRSFDEWRRARGELELAVGRLEKTTAVRERLRHRQAEVRHSLGAARATERKHQELREQQRDLGRALERELGRVFDPRDVARASRELTGEVQRVGWKEAGRRLVSEPERYGRLLGAGIGRVRTAKRSAALEAAVRVGRVAVQIAAVRGASLALGPTAERAALEIRRLTRTVQRVGNTLDRMPTRRSLEVDVAKKALALGVDVAALALKPNVLQAVRTALRTFDLVRSAAREDRGMER
jgi:hypothetical protein